MGAMGSRVETNPWDSPRLGRACTQAAEVWTEVQNPALNPLGMRLQP